jgi:hypothetical protein
MNSISYFDSIIKSEGKKPEDWFSLLNELKGNNKK